ncbi:MAG: hypothetical protein AMXMBFR84_48140 [Candidatus Hydrogenedentota bacterium]
MRTVDTVEKKASAMAIGSAKTVLVKGEGNDAVATIATVHAQATEDRSVDRFQSSGPGRICRRTIAHYSEVLGPGFRESRIEKLVRSRFVLSVSNVHLSAAQNRQLEVDGFSADVPAFIALISAALGIPCRSDVLFSLHVASPDGTCALVANLPAKIHAACADPEISTFVCADPDRDFSFGKLARDAYQAIQDAIWKAKGHIEIVFAENLAEVLRLAFLERNLVLSALINGYFSEVHDKPLRGATDLVLTESLHPRFWAVLESAWLDQEMDAARELLTEFTRYHEYKRKYPSLAGRTLYRILVALPPYIRVQLRFPLLFESELTGVVTRAKDTDIDDVRYLLNANAGDRLPNTLTATLANDADGDGTDENPDLKALLATIDPDVIRRDVIEPIESAMATYRLDGAVVGSDESYLSVPANYYLHLLRHTHEVKDVRSNGLEDEATALLARAFAHAGGLRAAQAEAKNGAPHGGMRYVLERMGRQYAAEQEHMYVQHAIELQLQQLSYERRVALVAALIDRFRPYLTEMELETAPDQFLKNPELLVRAYMQTAAALRSVFRAL